MPEPRKTVSFPWENPKMIGKQHTVLIEGVRNREVSIVRSQTRMGEPVYLFVWDEVCHTFLWQFPIRLKRGKIPTTNLQQVLPMETSPLWSTQREPPGADYGTDLPDN